MAKYQVTGSAVVRFTVEVEAASESEAEGLAMELDLPRFMDGCTVEPDVKIEDVCLVKKTARGQ